MNYPFTLSRRKNSPFFQVRFKNTTTGKYDTWRSTGQTSKAEAVKVAMQWYTNGIPTTAKINGTKTKDTMSQSANEICGLIKNTTLNDTEKEKIVEVLKKEGVIKSAVVTGSKQDIPLIDYLVNLWTWEKSPYVQEKLRMQHTVHKRHISNNLSLVKKYWLPYFGGKLLGELTRTDLQEFLYSLNDYEISGATKNEIFASGATALRYAFKKELIEKDIASTNAFILYKRNTQPRNILSRELMQAVLAVEWQDERSKLAFIVSTFTGMRAGEIQALRLHDLGENCLYVQHSFSYTDGLKSTKNGENRTVYIPYPQVIEALKQLAYQNPHDDFFVFYGLKKGTPMDSKKWLVDFRKALLQTGAMSEAETKKYCFHSQRHFFTSYMKSIGTPDRVLQQQTGHKTLAMLEHYANHTTDTDTDILTHKQSEMITGLLGDTDRRIIHDVKPSIQSVSKQDILQQLPKPTAKNPLDALQEAKLFDGTRAITDKGLFVCALYLLHYGYTVTPELLRNVHKQDGTPYDNGSIYSLLQKAKTALKKAANA